MRPRPHGIAAVLLAVGLGAAGCAPAGGTAADPAQPAPFGNVVAGDPATLPALHRAYEQDTAACMLGRGYTYHPEPLSTQDSKPPRNPYGLLTATEAGADGYGLTSGALAAPPADPNQARSTDSGWRTALLGTAAHQVTVQVPGGQAFFYNSDACLTTAEDQLYGPDYQRLHNTFQVLTNQVLTAVQQDPRYLAAQRDWAACMGRAGVAVKELADAPALVGDRLGQAGQDPAAVRAVGLDELRTARTDAGCQRSSALAAAVAAAQPGAERATLGTHAADLDRLRALTGAAVARATTGNAPAAGRVATAERSTTGSDD
ncbi:hypothetical protein OG455_01040 [Kitasatospora sp. NBC_01287]|uniref:hypothetical protein n=1 Tax=Kitasatospora sp. NBC_01287 TaxID=2903573 RepID=UPI002257CE30|nr:hypothetical protein [Kitasatospora sp. NBC_01287]MCX4744110.1 hypothetical protein [Kitasatospora sp. NBC_01287]